MTAHVSAPYRSTDLTIALNTYILVFLLTLHTAPEYPPPPHLVAVAAFFSRVLTSHLPLLSFQLHSPNGRKLPQPQCIALQSNCPLATVSLYPNPHGLRLLPSDGHPPSCRTYMHTHTHTCTHAHTHICTHAHIHTCTHTYTCTHTQGPS